MNRGYFPSGDLMHSSGAGGAGVHSKAYVLLLFLVFITKSVHIEGAGDVILGRSVLDLEKKNTCEYYGEHGNVFSDSESFRSRICIVPEGGLHGVRDHPNRQKQFGAARHGGREALEGRLKRRDEHMGSIASDLGGSSMREERKRVDLESLFGIGEAGESRSVHSEGLARVNSSEELKGKSMNETNNFSLFKLGLLDYQDKKIMKYYLYDVSNKKYSSKIAYPDNVISASSAYNYLANYVQVYEISKVSKPTVVSWPFNHIVFVHSQVGTDGVFKFVVYTTSGQTGFYFEVANGAYKTGCGSYSRSDNSKFTHGPNSLIQVQLVRRRFGFNVFVDGTRRTKLDIIDCISSQPTKIEITSGQGSQIYPKVEDCQVSQWTDWSACSKTCSTGSMVRYRSVIMPSMNDGVPCPKLMDTVSCNADVSCSPCQYTDWTAWSECSATCGTGTTSRTRKLISAKYFIESCIETFQAKSCKGASCSRDCIVTEWSDWSDCSTSCNVGNQISTRSIVQPEQNGGTCDFKLSKVQECNVSVCKKSCDPTPCLNGGICGELPMSNFICTCPPFYGGETCDSFEFPWWFYYVVIVLAVLAVGILYKFLFSNIVTPNTMDPSYGADGGYAFSQGAAPPPPVPQPPQGPQGQYYQDMNNYNYGYYNNANEGYLVNNDDGNWMY
ncbi:signal peptide-containing protein [Cryptosporidium canis]|uniref:Signal peptide-containing protein n=1 Tax=Cryptosporidium canis TaxID=195482 RepID=A0ABQ8P8I6_9CRYT|nr:signal peptide-containing protein [Cryptosporidium canis]